MSVLAGLHRNHCTAAVVMATFTEKPKHNPRVCEMRGCHTYHTHFIDTPLCARPTICQQLGVTPVLGECPFNILHIQLLAHCVSLLMQRRDVTNPLLLRSQPYFFIVRGGHPPHATLAMFTLLCFHFDPFLLHKMELSSKTHLFDDLF